MKRFVDHYAKGRKAATKMPLHWQEYPITYSDQISAVARLYDTKWRDTHTVIFPEDPGFEYRVGIEDTLWSHRESVRYAVFSWISAGMYNAADAVSPLFEGYSQARRWLEDNLTEEQHFHGGKESRGHCVRSCYILTSEVTNAKDN